MSGDKEAFIFQKSRLGHSCRRATGITQSSLIKRAPHPGGEDHACIANRAYGEVEFHFLQCR
jgi:hypothetical protein